MKDVLIIGGGPAGLTAALYATRYGYKATVFEGYQHGGQVATTFEVENYPAIERITGLELATKLYEQAVNLGVNIVNEKAVKIKVDKNIKTVYTEKNEYSGKTIIIATGAKRRKLGCMGEDEFLGLGVSYCASCDGNFFKNKDAVIVGGGNTAIEDALFLSNICKKVILVHRKNSFRAFKTLTKAVMSKSNIEIIYNAQVISINGTSVVESIEIKTDKEQYNIKASGIFIAIGTEPNNEFLSGIINMDEHMYIISNEDCATNVEGVFVAGDCRTKKLRQIVTATADGGASAFMAAKYLSLLE